MFAIYNKTVVIPPVKKIDFSTIDINNQVADLMTIDTVACTFKLTNPTSQIPYTTSRFCPILQGYNDSGYQLILNNNPYEVNLKFAIGSSAGSWSNVQALWCIPYYTTAKGLYISYSAKKLAFYPNSGLQTLGSTVMDVDTPYYVRLVREVNPDAYYVYLSSDGVNYNLECSVTGSAASTYVFHSNKLFNFISLMYNPYSGGNYTYLYEFTGTLYMDGCNMKDGDGKLIWQPYVEKPEQYVKVNKYYI